MYDIDLCGSLRQNDLNPIKKEYRGLPFRKVPSHLQFDLKKAHLLGRDTVKEALFKEEVLAELVWRARDVQDDNCPKNVKEVRALLERSSDNATVLPPSEAVGLEFDQSDAELTANTPVAGRTPKTNRAVAHHVRQLRRNNKDKPKVNPSHRTTKEAGQQIHSLRGLPAFTRTPTKLARSILYYATRLAIATSEENMALEYISLYLLSFPNETTEYYYSPNELRLILSLGEFYPQIRHQQIYTSILKKFYGRPVVLRSDIFYTVMDLCCLRKAFREGREWLQSIAVSKRQFAIKPMAGYLQAGELLLQYAESQGQLTISDNIMSLFSSIFSEYSKQKQVPPLTVFRLYLAIMFSHTVSTSEAILDFLGSIENFLALDKTNVQLLELKLLFLGHYCKKFSQDNRLLVPVMGMEFDELLEETAIQYVAVARGEFRSVALALDLGCKPLPILLTSIYSNSTSPMLWKLLIETAKNAAEIEEVLPPAELHQWKERFFSPSRKFYRRLTRQHCIYLLIAAPLFRISKNDIIEIAKGIAQYIPWPKLISNDYIKVESAQKNDAIDYIVMLTDGFITKRGLNVLISVASHSPVGLLSPKGIMTGSSDTPSSVDLT